ncbi:MAG: DUF389 domain-containing protein [Bacteroidia bacterium]|nr:DUF389 domain-containing protein [Bacteroidia bacterium]
MRLQDSVTRLTGTLLHYLDLRNEVEPPGSIQEEIEKGIVFKGTNLWILVFAIVVASVGLNTNSTAVIIGAMLISPLMGPINGMGYGIATYQFDLFRRALRNFGFAVGASLAASTLYFAISPVSTAYSELLARTSPTIYDVLIAMFGGMAGIVAISSKQKGNVIPGVAIATALMPPLCTAGYGLATRQPGFFAGAFYLFTINTVFIGLSSIIMSRVLDLPVQGVPDPVQKKRVLRWIWIITGLTLLPSIYFGYRLVIRERFSSQAARFAQQVTTVDGRYLLRHEVQPERRQVRLIYGGAQLTPAERAKIYIRAAQFQLDSTSLILEQGLALDEPQNPPSGSLRQLSELSRQLEAHTRARDSVAAIPELGGQLLAEIAPLYPQIRSCAYAESLLHRQDSSAARPVPVVVFGLRAGSRLRSGEEAALRAWLEARLGRSRVLMAFQPAE